MKILFAIRRANLDVEFKRDLSSVVSSYYSENNDSTNNNESMVNKADHTQSNMDTQNPNQYIRYRKSDWAQISKRYNGSFEDTPPAHLPSNFIPQDHDGHEMTTKIIIITIATVCGVGLIAAVSVFYITKKRKEKKKENMANAFFEFSAENPSQGIAKVSPLKKKVQAL
ncbi:hypothetical protein BY458DRAFT_521300 [Sporodiniella umbellata]|nr:hypothetical protein BY458DRAFT_521300 [Sporodiniella umbellata]